MRHEPNKNMCCCEYEEEEEEEEEKSGVRHEEVNSAVALGSDCGLTSDESLCVEPTIPRELVSHQSSTLSLVSRRCVSRDISLLRTPLNYVTLTKVLH